MTTVTLEHASTDKMASSHSVNQVINRVLLHSVVILICLIWLLPTLGLLVSSFRPKPLISSSGWWTAFAQPSNFTLDLYREALSSRGMGQSFINSLFIAIPSTMLPILLAA